MTYIIYNPYPMWGGLQIREARTETDAKAKVRQLAIEIVNRYPTVDGLIESSRFAARTGDAAQVEFCRMVRQALADDKGRVQRYDLIHAVMQEIRVEQAA